MEILYLTVDPKFKGTWCNISSIRWKEWNKKKYIHNIYVCSELDKVTKKNQNKLVFHLQIKMYCIFT